MRELFVCLVFIFSSSSINQALHFRPLPILSLHFSRHSKAIVVGVTNPEYVQCIPSPRGCSGDVYISHRAAGVEQASLALLLDLTRPEPPNLLEKAPLFLLPPPPSLALLTDANANANANTSPLPAPNFFVSFLVSEKSSLKAQAPSNRLHHFCLSIP